MNQKEQKINLDDIKYAGVKIALSMLIKKTFKKGSEIGFEIGRKHFKIIRDK